MASQNFRSRLPIALFFLAFIAILCGFAVSAGTSKDDKKPQPTIDWDAYNYYMDFRLGDITALERRYAAEQTNYLPINMPDPDFMLREDMGLVPFDWASFPERFNTNLIPHYLNSVPVYRVSVVEDSETRAKIILNADGAIIYALPPARDYNPYVYLEGLIPNLSSGTYTTDEIDMWQALYDPARIMITIDLIPSEYLSDYLYVESELNVLRAGAAPASGKGGIIMMRSQSAETSLVFDGIRRTNGNIQVEIGYPTTFTNHLEIYSSTDLVSYAWSIAVTNLSTIGTNTIYWTDSNTAGRAYQYYAAGNGDWDTDGDGLVDGREKYLYRTSATTNDTDGDTLTDYEEVINRHTDPNNSDTNPPIVLIRWPTNATRRIWLP